MNREFRLAPPNSGRGVSCDTGGAFVGSVPLLKRSTAAGEWEPRDCWELSEQIGGEFGLPIDMTSKIGGLNAISRALNEGDIARAQVATVLLGIPDPPKLSNEESSHDEFAKFISTLGWSGLIKVWEADQHPRWDAGAPDDQGGRFKEKYLLVAEAEPDDPDEDLEPTINGQTAEESRRASEIDNQAGAEDEKEREAEAAGQETKQQYRSKIDRIQSDREKVQWWKEEAANYSRRMRLPPDRYTEKNLERMRRGLGPFGSDGFPMELHHPNGLPWEPLEPIDRTDHRLGPNFRINHSFLFTKTMLDIFLYSIGRNGRYAGVFEADDQVSWFYFHDLDAQEGTRILGAVQVYGGFPDFTAEDVEVRWYDRETKVGVFIGSELGAYFDLATGWGYPGTYWRTHRGITANSGDDSQEEPPQTI